MAKCRAADNIDGLLKFASVCQVLDQSPRTVRRWIAEYRIETSIWMPARITEKDLRKLELPMEGTNLG